MTRQFLLLFIIVVIGVAAFYFTKKVPISISTKNSPVSFLLATPTPMPFAEITIPYLRTKKYDSQLGPREQLADNGSYISYLTSYTSEGLKINGLLTIPKEEGKHPAIVFLHGYIPPGQYQTTGQYADYVDYLARNGFVVFKIDLRGHNDSEGRAGGGYFGGDYVTDTLNAYSALEHAKFVDPKKIGLWGHSMAGNIVLRSLAVKPEIPAAVIWAGAVYSYEDRERYGISDSSFTASSNPTGVGNRQRIMQMYGSASSNNSFWKEMAPTNFLSDIKGAIEIHHAVDDPVVNVGYSRDLIKLLDQTNIEHQLYEYPSGGHNITGGSFVHAMQRTVDFFKKKL